MLNTTDKNKNFNDFNKSQIVMARRLGQNKSETAHLMKYSVKLWWVTIRSVSRKIKEIRQAIRYQSFIDVNGNFPVKYIIIDNLA